MSEIPIIDPDEAAAGSPSRWGMVRRRLARDPVALAMALLLGAILFGAIFAPYIAPHNPLETNLRLRALPPSANYLLGTDEQGRDILSRLLYGTRLTLLISFSGLIIGAVSGSTLGILAAFYPRAESPLMRVTDILLSFPAILIGLALASILGSGPIGIVAALSIATLPLSARIARGAASAITHQDYVAAGWAIGLGDGALMWRYILRNCLSTIIVFTTLRFGQVILLAASLSFLGLGIGPPTPELGTMVSQGRSLIYNAPHVCLIPCFAIFVIVTILNVLGDTVRDLLDPRAAEVV